MEEGQFAKLPSELLRNILYWAARGATADRVAELLSVCMHFRCKIKACSVKHATHARPDANQPLKLQECAAYKLLVVEVRRGGGGVSLIDQHSLLSDTAVAVQALTSLTDRYAAAIEAFGGLLVRNRGHCQCGTCLCCCCAGECPNCAVDLLGQPAYVGITQVHKRADLLVQCRIEWSFRSNPQHPASGRSARPVLILQRMSASARQYAITKGFQPLGIVAVINIAITHLAMIDSPDMVCI